MLYGTEGTISDSDDESDSKFGKEDVQTDSESELGPVLGAEVDPNI